MGKQSLLKWGLLGALAIVVVVVLVWKPWARSPAEGGLAKTAQPKHQEKAVVDIAGSQSRGRCELAVSVRAGDFGLGDVDVCILDIVHGLPLACQTSDARGHADLEVDCADSRAIRVRASHASRVLKNPPSVTLRATERTLLSLDMIDADARIEGRTVDIAGGVVQGASVELTCRTSGIESSYSSTSDERGEFSLPHPSACKPWRIYAHAEGYASRPAGLSPGHRLELLLYPAATVSGEVVQDGRSVGFAAVSVAPLGSLGEPVAATMSGPDGSYVLRNIPPGNWIIHASTSEGTGHSPIVQLLPGKPLSGQRIELRAAATVEAEVSHCEGGVVELRAKRKLASPVVGMISDTGIARFEGVLPAIPYTLKSRCGGNRGATSEAFTPIAGELTVISLVVPDEAGATIRGKVGLETWMQRDAWAVLIGAHQTKVEVGEEGRFVLDGIVDGEYTLVAQFESLRSAEAVVVVANGRATPEEVELTLPASATVEVQVVGDDLRPIPYLAAEVSAAGVVQCATLTAPGDGMFRCTFDAAHATESLSLILSEGAWRHEGELVLGENQVQLDTGSIWGTIVDQSGTPVDFAELRVTPEQGRPGLEVHYSNDDGSFEIDTLVGGRYVVTARVGVVEVSSEPIAVGSSVLLSLPTTKQVELVASVLPEGGLVWVTISRQGQFFPIYSLDAAVVEGRVMLPALSPGQYSVVVDFAEGSCKADFDPAIAGSVALAC